jgi:hypothetical protein
MKCLIVLSVDLPEPEEVVGVLKQIDPPTIPYFSGEVRVVVGTAVDETIAFLDGP